MKKNEPTIISIITPTFNRMKLLLRLWNSIKNQKFPSFEWIIIDDGSTDDTEFEIKKLKDNRIKYFKQKNKGVNAARLKGETKININSKYVIYIDSDDAFYSNETILDMLNYISKTDYSISSVIFSSVDGNTGELVSILPENKDRIKYIDSLVGEKFVGDAIAIQKTQTLKDAYWPEQVSGCEFLRHWKLNKKYDFLSINKPGKKYYRDRQDNLTSPEMTIKRSKSLVEGLDLAIKCFSKDLKKYAKRRFSNLLFSRILYSSFCESKILTIKKIIFSFRNLYLKQKCLSVLLLILLLFPKKLIIKIYKLFNKYKYSA